MKILRGTVHEGKVTLPADSQLAEGTPVLIAVGIPGDTTAAASCPEEALIMSATQLPGKQPEGESNPAAAGQARKPTKLMDLQGLGKEIWQGEGAAAYLDRLRAGWG